MTDLSTLQLEHFAPLVEQAFSLDTGSETIQVRLIEAKAFSRLTSPRHRIPFSLIFLGPTQPAIAQGTYSLSAAGGFAAPLFLVPVRQDESGMHYQAVFN